MRQKALPLRVRATKLLQALRERLGTLDDTRFETDVLRKELVSQLAILLELVAVVLKEPRVVQRDGGLRPELLDDRNGPSVDPITMIVPFDDEHPKAEATRKEERDDQDIPRRRHDRRESRVRHWIEPSYELEGPRVEPSLDHAVHARRVRCGLLDTA